MKRNYKELFAAGIIENAKCENPFLNVTGEVVRLLEEAILTMRLEPYEKLNISHLAEALEVSTTSCTASSGIPFSLSASRMMPTRHLFE